MIDNDEIIFKKLKLPYTFRNNQLLIQALTHRSCGKINNERLEFLGDGLLNFVIGEELYSHQNQFDECALTRLRAKLVCKEALAGISKNIGVGDAIQLSGSELKTGGRQRKSTLANTLEAIMGAILIDGGYAASKQFILALYQDYFENLPNVEDLIDPKTKLQELLQSQGLALPNYELVDSFGPDHKKQFEVLCSVKNQKIFIEKGLGSTRQKAEQNAAAKIIKLIND